MFEDDYFGFARAALIMFIFSFGMIGFMVWVSYYMEQNPPPDCSPDTMNYCQWRDNK